MGIGFWHLYACGINHENSTVSEREPIQVTRADLAAANSSFGTLEGVIESTVVSTCNRIEFYFVTARQEDPLEFPRRFYRQFKNLGIDDLMARFYVKKDRHAADHLMRVAAGLDSMILGENQILGQLKESYSSACSVRSAGKVIHRLFHQAFRAGKQARTETEIGRGVCSVSGAAMEELDARLNAFNMPEVLFIGVNQMIAHAASHIGGIDHGRLTFANRTLEKAGELVKTYGGEAHGLDQLPALLRSADIIVSCTSATTPIVTRDLAQEAFGGEPGRQRLIFNLAIPHDIDLPGGVMSWVEVIDLDWIRDFLRGRQLQKEKATSQVEAIIDTRLGEFIYWYDHARRDPLYDGLNGYFETIRRQELGPIVSELPPEIGRRVDSAVSRLFGRLVDMQARLSLTPADDRKEYHE